MPQREDNRKPLLASSERIWDRDPHSAFTDLVRYRGRWFCTFRTGQGHVSPDGAIQVLSSTDGERWEPVARLTSATGDLRDPKLSITPNGQLMIVAASALNPPATYKHQTLTYFSTDGRNWSEPTPVGDRNVWLWRVIWHKGTGYGVGYGTTNEARFARLYSTKDGKQFQTVVETLFEPGFPNEASLLFLPDDTALCFLRRDAAPYTAQLGFAKPPYTDWTWKDLGVRVGGPHLIRLPDGRIIAAVRLYDKPVRTALCWLDPEKATLTEFLPFPTGGDTSYAGLALQDDTLWTSYYSSHTGKTCIYMAKVDLNPK